MHNTSYSLPPHTHIILVSGEWDFYVFQGEGGESPPLPPHLVNREPEDLLEGLER